MIINKNKITTISIFIALFFGATLSKAEDFVSQSCLGGTVFDDNAGIRTVKSQALNKCRSQGYIDCKVVVMPCSGGHHKGIARGNVKSKKKLFYISACYYGSLSDDVAIEAAQTESVGYCQLDGHTACEERARTNSCVYKKFAYSQNGINYYDSLQGYQSTVWLGK